MDIRVIADTLFAPNARATREKNDSSYDTIHKSGCETWEKHLSADYSVTPLGTIPKALCVKGVPLSVITNLVAQCT